MKRNPEIAIPWVLIVVLLAAAPAAMGQQWEVWDSFDEGASVLERWHDNNRGGIFPVSTPVHLGDSALAFQGTADSCLRWCYREGFSASLGEYSVWVFQQDAGGSAAAGGAMNVQVQDGASDHPNYRQCYSVHWSALGSSWAHFSILKFLGDGSYVTLGNLTPQFPMNQWVRIFLTTRGDGQLVAGYEYDGVVDSITSVDPQPIIAPGRWYLTACTIGPEPQVMDDAAFTSGPCHDRLGDYNCDGFEDAVDLALLIDRVFFGGDPATTPCPQAGL